MAGSERGTKRLSTRRARGSLLAEDVVTAAVRVIEQVGLDALTMPLLSIEMDVPVTSIYWHFRTKDDLIVAVAERVTAELYASLPPVDPECPWDAEVFNYFANFRRAMLEHRAFLDLFATRSRSLWADPAIGMLITERLEAAVGVLVQAGRIPTEAITIYTACSTYVRGFAMIEVFQQREDVSPADLETAAARTAGLDPTAFPHLSGVAVFDAAMRYDDRQFEIGLRLLIDGIKVSE